MDRRVEDLPINVNLSRLPIPKDDEAIFGDLLKKSYLESLFQAGDSPRSRAGLKAALTVGQIFGGPQETHSWQVALAQWLSNEGRNQMKQAFTLETFPLELTHVPPQALLDPGTIRDPDIKHAPDVYLIPKPGYEGRITIGSIRAVVAGIISTIHPRK